MKYISVRPGCNINKEDIIKVEDVDMMNCKVYTQVGVEDSIYPSWRILMLLEEPTIEEQIAAQPQISDRTNLFGAQHFAG